MRLVGGAGLGLAAGLLVGCGTGPAAPPVASRPATPPTAASSPPGPSPVPVPPEVSAQEARGFRACLAQHGIRLPEDEQQSGNEERMRTAIEACASRLRAGEAVRVPVVDGSAFQACLERNGVKLPAPGEWLTLDRGRDAAMDAALQRC